MSKKFIFIILLLGTIYSFNLRKGQKEIKYLDTLLKDLPSIYESLYNKILNEKSEISKELTSAYFKQIESNSKTKYYLDKDENDFDFMIEDVINTMGISNKKHAYVFDTFRNQIDNHQGYMKNHQWMCFNIITTVRTDKNTIAYGSLYVNKIEQKYNFIFTYGHGDFNRIFSARNAIFLGRPNEFVEPSNAYSSSSKDFPDSRDEYSLMHFLNLVGFKSFGNEYDLPLPEPKFD